MDYSSYLKLNQLLALQQPQSPPSEHRNEILFIITHQTYELWFKHLIIEIHHAIELINGRQIAEVINTVSRINAIMQTLVHQVSIIETLKAHEFQRFRDYLGSASGFQSWQFAAIEILLASTDKRKLKHYEANKTIKKKLAAIIAPASLWETVCRQLIGAENSHQNSNMIIKEILAHPSCESLLLYKLLDLDALLQEWRYRHVKLVERTIGQRPGTGGSDGVNYLKSKLFSPVFVELWAAIN